uniref:Uncharacterized protein n=1 Tax=viral metagenome TaxID=1070528 RepID=A0A6M3KXV4_9ZZZZ
MWIPIRSEKLHRIVCEIEPALSLVRVRERGETDIIELEKYGIRTEPITQSQGIGAQPTQKKETGA